MELEMKFQKLKDNIQGLKSVAIAYSGGVDSTFLLKVAADVLGNKVIAITAKSTTYPEREFKEAVKYIEDIGAKHIVIISEELEIEGFAKNPIDRCYFCKKELFSKVRKVADDNNINAVLDGSNADDVSDYRPGMKAANELRVISPLKDAFLTKDNIRELSKRLGLPTWNKPAFACLSSRFPYGNEITVEKLSMVERAEQFLLDLGFRQIRVRHHGDIARVEVNAEERNKFFSTEMMDKVANELKSIGFKYVTLDLLGYRTGSMNEVLSDKEKNSVEALD
ncbi:ATP-dependent sacrificial sulfur transferase LarE [Clostridium estertheticum]|uniref:TIGR00268 family protein n=1 Tax=Clostridium estertheticum subsp. estertheticum TaxID=1552 RepID=A0A1J0GGE5_9CLOT|nr:ATP-dependent sacrificial sulfur transferase LarE [Clostridium estertheticum]APC40433.1 TIGR00268 family protein [Clostridium estertheticum subsp. estertheticum]MBU3173097.1 ATP-dependent sacrificial sulfur transferase LarE [Clostridium estertheticum]MBZ9617746.1 ATP-dependent sacrificial sulfur transferase LarE [Clostridium estertheticum subsp. laramiense]WAG73418.1 ATP-dependent sacrificial sulfur transferase LarE [Clostridium estertheticum]